MSTAPADIAYAAQRAYTTYGEAVGWKAVSGNDMPRWAALGEKIQGAWIKATGAVLAYGQMIAAGKLTRSPHVSATVHYVSRGSADGAYPSTCRAAMITEVCTPAYLGSSKPIGYEMAMTVGLFVANPEGTYHLTLQHGGCKYWRAEDGTGLLTGGTWHWAEECTAP